MPKAIAPKESSQVEKLIKTKDDLIVKASNGQALMHLVARLGNVKILNAILKSFDEKDIMEVLSFPNSDSLQAVHVVAQVGHVNIVNRIIEFTEGKALEATADGQGLIHYAADDGHLDLLKILIDKWKVDVNSKDCVNSTPLHHAVTYGQQNIASFLLSQLDSNIMVMNDYRFL